jgi:hypothetical protein
VSVVRTMFILYVTLIVAGIAAYAVVGLTHH